MVQRWAIRRDVGGWDRFREVWHPDGWMSATWFDGPFEEFIRASRQAFAAGWRIPHFLGGTAVEVAGDRAAVRHEGEWRIAASRSTSTTG